MKLTTHSYRYVESVAEFYKFHTTNHRLVVIYSASWCKPCNLLKGWLDSDYKDYPHPILVLDVENIALDPLVESVQGMPTIEFIEDKSVVKKVGGFNQMQLKETLDKWKDEAIQEQVEYPVEP